MTVDLETRRWSLLLIREDDFTNSHGFVVRVIATVVVVVARGLALVVVAGPIVHPVTKTLNLALCLEVGVLELVRSHDCIHLDLGDVKQVTMVFFFGPLGSALVFLMSFLEGLFVFKPKFLGLCLEDGLAILEHGPESGRVLLLGFISGVGGEVVEEEGHGVVFVKE